MKGRFCNALWRVDYIGPGNGLLPDGTKPLREQVLSSVALTSGQFRKTSIRKMSLKNSQQ